SAPGRSHHRFPARRGAGCRLRFGRAGAAGVADGVGAADLYGAGAELGRCAVADLAWAVVEPVCRGGAQGRRRGWPARGVPRNYSYEWGCTTGAAPDGDGVTLMRTLDWPFDGLGRALVVMRQQGAAGPYLSVTWPAFAGVLTGLAPGRFAAAIN